MNVSGMIDISAHAGAPGSHGAQLQTRGGILGATGYAGRELIAILARHPKVRIVTLMSSGRQGAEAFPIEKSHAVLKRPALGAGGATVCEPLNLDDLTPSELDVVFLATPHETSHDVVPILLARGLRVIDLSGAFRLKDGGSYMRWYGCARRSSLWVAGAEHGSNS